MFSSFVQEKEKQLSAAQQRIRVGSQKKKKKTELAKVGA